MLKVYCVITLLVMGGCMADVYLHNPRGSNNRLNERSANRNNANRVFDSQNNNRGGYNVGDATSSAADSDATQQYRMKYFQSGAYKTYSGEYRRIRENSGRSKLVVEWTNQHGCGANMGTNPHKQNCDIVIQYMCQATADNSVREIDRLRDGTSTTRQDYTSPAKLTETKETANERKSSNVQADRALQESWESYDDCYMRERNKGLFVADQKLRKNKLGCGATYTRQNPNGNRRGYECPEERDYFPYWHPTLWKDIAILTSDTSRCNLYTSESYNVAKRHACVKNYPGTTLQRHGSRWNNQADCERTGGKWTAFTNFLEKATKYKTEAQCVTAVDGGLKHVWAIPYLGAKEECLVALDPPECSPAPWTRSNHLGNSLDGQAPTYSWTLPYFPSKTSQQCVLRIRYNISTDDYEPFNTDYKQNNNPALEVVSPVRQNPYVNIGAGNTNLRLAINTAQFGRTFQDRSHVFELRARPDSIADSAVVHNLNVRGKRGNIVQTYPAVEYDFTPNHLQINAGELVHIQWTGSNTHNNNQPAGDGQAGDAGEGTAGTDRHNMAEVRTLNENFPLPFEKSSLWDNSEVVWIYHGKTNVSPANLALNLLSAGYYRCFATKECPESAHSNYIFETKDKLDGKLNQAPASYEGVVLKINKGKYYYMCTRNNNFTNRSQKGSITIR